MSKPAPKKGAPVASTASAAAAATAAAAAAAAEAAAHPAVEAPQQPPPAAAPPAPTSGSGRFVYADGSVYEGQYSVREGGLKARHGQGRFAGPHFSYDGAWENDVMHGTGTYIGSLGAVYSGELRQGRYHGAGRYRWPDGAT